MVAYSFNTAFVPKIEARTKRQTIRLPRKRHARPGELVQLFTGMRTKHCRKLIPDPLCVGVDEVRFDLREAATKTSELAGSVLLEVNGIPLTGADAEAYAVSDGFSAHFDPFGRMAFWWLRVHGRVLFEGVAIRWQDLP